MSHQSADPRPGIDVPLLEHRVRAWRDTFLLRQIRTAAWLALGADLFFALLDHLLFPDRFWAMQRPRLLFAGGAAAAILLVRWHPARRRPWLPFLVVYWAIASALAWLNLLTGGFDSPYAFSFFLLVSGFGILIPVAPFLHLIGAVGSYLLYVGVLLSAGRADPEHLSRLLNLTFGYVAAIAIVVFAVSIYERLQRRRLRDRAELEAVNRRLRELDAAKSRFFANVSHELRTPLTLILGILERHQRERPDDTLETALRNARRLAGLIDDLLELATLRDTRVQLRSDRVDLAALTARLVADFAAAHPARRFAYRGPRRGVHLASDPHHLETILSNLLTNAVKFTTPPDGRIEVELEVCSGEVRLHVCDDGPGIPHQEQDGIFAPFTRAAGVDQLPGVGLGLALARESAELLGGEIRLTSSPEAGTRFSLSLPRTDSSPHTPNVPAEATPGTTPTVEPPLPNPQRRILIVEDDPDLRELLYALLTPHYHVDTARDGHEALSRLGHATYAAVVTDLTMPGLDGLGLVRRLRSEARHRPLPVLVLTARGREDLPLEVRTDPHTRLLHKPFERTMLFAALATLLPGGDTVDDVPTS